MSSNKKHEEYYKGGWVFSGPIRARYYTNDEEKIDGEYIIWYPSGSIRERSFYDNGILRHQNISSEDGSVSETSAYDEEGELFEYTRFKNGKRIRQYITHQDNPNRLTFKEWDMNGELLEESIYEEGNLVRRNKIKKRNIDYNLAKYSKINGPVSFAAVQYGDKFVLLFGDFHTYPIGTCAKCHNNNDCVGLLKWLIELFKSSDACIDMFFEEPLFNLGGTSNREREALLINQISNAFADCFKDDNECLKYGNVRMHFSDIRRQTGLMRFKTKGSMFQYKALHEIGRYDHPLSFIKELSEQNTIYNTLMYYIGKMDRSELDYLSKVMLKSDSIDVRGRIKKQLDGIEDRSLRNHIVEFFSNRIKDKNEVVLMVMALLPQTKNYYAFRGSIISMIAELMNLYAMARFFKTSLDDSNTVVFYAGDGHIDAYIDFFKTLKNTKVLIRHKARSIGRKCIKFSRKERELLSEYLYDRVETPTPCSRRRRVLDKRWTSNLIK